MQIEIARKNLNNIHILIFIAKLVLQKLRTVKGKAVTSCKCHASRLATDRERQTKQTYWARGTEILRTAKRCQ